MCQNIPPLLTIEAPLRRERGVLHLLEPPESCRDSLWQRLFDGTYNKPFILDRGVRRFLHFDLHTVQSAMNLKHPDRLSLAYTRKMMSFLLFNEAPSRLLLLGLGGGSLAKFCHQHLADAAITVVEKSPDVISLRGAFHVPPDDQRFQVVCADAASYLMCTRQSVDVILADACDRAGVAPGCDTPEFYRNIYESLSDGGVLVVNLCANIFVNANHTREIRTVFGDHLVTLRVKREGNVILLAFKTPQPSVSCERLESVATALKGRFGLDFPRYVRRARERTLSLWPTHTTLQL